ncbi:hypothetical protein ACFVVA_37105 [Kitasatospora sp. NPDC058048]|uniref:hypothetical protein n=1 Tax=Kitasatospora sp. NPDC058048 TaxID=3346313 RepID=UPI0036DAF3CC
MDIPEDVWDEKIRAARERGASAYEQTVRDAAAGRSASAIARPRFRHQGPNDDHRWVADLIE